MTRALVIQLVEALEKLSDTEQTYAALDKADAVITAAREYLATDPIGERAELIEKLRAKHDERFVVSPSIYSKAADMLETDAQQAKRVPDLNTGQHEPISHSGADEVPPIFGRRWRLARDGFGLQRDDESGNYVQIDDAISTMHVILAASKEAKRVPLTDAEAHQTLVDMAANIEKFGDGTESNEQLSSECIRFILERVDNHGITPADKPTDDEPEDLYALALKADNWGQP